MTPRAVLLPSVWQPRDPSKVAIRHPTISPTDYFETVLTPEEAEDLALDLLIDARRARAYRGG